MNRRDLLKGLAAGGIIVAGELWIPGQRLISIPKPRHIMKLDETIIPGIGTVNWIVEYGDKRYYMTGTYRKLEENMVQIMSEKCKWHV